jgi:TP901 family phage tail tape measure protein
MTMGLDAGSVVAHLRLDAAQFNAALSNAQQQMQSFSRSLTRMGSYLTIRATLPLTIFGTKAVKSFSQFNDAIIRAAAVTRDMTNDMRKEMEKTAITISKTSILSATELAEGYFALGQAGYAAAQSIKILPVVEEFAVAATIDLDTSIRYLARTAEGLGMAMETPVEMIESMTNVSNAFTFAAITTTAEIQDFAVAMTHAAAPALKLVNKSMKEGISVLMAFARAGIVAEEAGTLLWTTVRDLQRANIRFRHEWKKLNIDVYDSTGTMRNMADIFEDLEAKFANMSDEAKKASLQMLGFQDRSLRGIQALMGFSEEMKIFQSAMDRMGNLTERVADTYKKSFNAQMKMAKHNIDAVVISIGWTLSPILIKINEQIKRFASWWETLANHTKLLIVEVGIFVAVLGPLLLVFGKMVFLLSFAAKGFGFLGNAILAAAKAAGWFVAIMSGWLAIGLLVVAVAYTLRAAWKQGLTAIKNRFQDFYNAVKGGVDWLANEVFGEFFTWFRESWEKVLNMTLDDIRSFMTEVAAETQATIAFWKQFPQMIKEAWTANTFTQAINRVKRGMQTAKEEYVRAFADVWRVNSKTRKSIDEFVTAADISLRALGEATKEHLVELGDALKKQFGEDVAYVTDLISEKVKMMNKNFLELLPGEDMMEIVVALDKVMKKLQEFDDIEVPIERWDKFMDDVADMAVRSVDIAMNAFKGLADTIATQLERGKADWKAFMVTILEEINRMIIEMLLAEVAYKQFLKPFAEGFGLGGIKQESAGAELVVAGTMASEALTTAGVVTATAIEAAGVTAAGALLPVGPAFSTVGTNVAVQLHSSGSLVATSILQAGLAAAAAITAAVGAGGGAGIPAGEATGVGGEATGGGTTGGGGATGGGGGGANIGSALGNVFSWGRLIAMRAGGIINQPTLAPIGRNRTAYIGEAGPEAVMPLSRTKTGELGVKAEQPNVVVEPKIKINNLFDREEQYEAMQSDRGEMIIVNVLKRKGLI